MQRGQRWGLMPHCMAVQRKKHNNTQHNKMADGSVFTYLGACMTLGDILHYCWGHLASLWEMARATTVLPGDIFQRIQ